MTSSEPSWGVSSACRAGRGSERLSGPPEVGSAVGRGARATTRGQAAGRVGTRWECLAGLGGGGCGEVATTDQGAAVRRRTVENGAGGGVGEVSR